MTVKELGPPTSGLKLEGERVLSTAGGRGGLEGPGGVVGGELVCVCGGCWWWLSVGVLVAWCV